MLLAENETVWQSGLVTLLVIVLLIVAVRYYWKKGTK